ncbi:hypothetical protein HMPREF3185_00427 [Porphyromonas somerae]|uniref:Uncharacterized protein n=1 Tax=Porphyromonas somerae TaxID=322095 RepID=A0A134BCS8_9PORP|nr:hypothetical protein HMPREF3184_00427 [Porphyromonadaceae bacterium KA00676]KXB77670.1 hypothetical protein HMPREF3185_00427 [Porphyromonas somerae]
MNLYRSGISTYIGRDVNLYRSARRPIQVHIPPLPKGMLRRGAPAMSVLCGGDEMLSYCREKVCAFGRMWSFVGVD